MKGIKEHACLFRCHFPIQEILLNSPCFLFFVGFFYIRSTLKPLLYFYFLFFILFLLSQGTWQLKWCSKNKSQTFSSVAISNTRLS